MDQGQIPVVPGFQGVSKDFRLSTLGRGGSDASAVALAKCIGADYRDWETDRKSTRLNSSHSRASRMPSSA